MIEFRLNLNPPTTTHHAKKIVKAGKFTRLADKPGLSNARALYCALLSQYKPSSPAVGPVRLTMAFTFPWRASESKKNLAKTSMPHTVKPDCSNLAKTLEDCLATMGFLTNDSQVCQLVVTKAYGNSPGIFIRIEPC